MALVLVLVVPLYGQVSCNRNCPPALNPCQISAGRSIETNQCVYAYADGAVCDFQGSDGICYQGDCVRADCAGDMAFSTCIEPLGGGFEGACIGDLCVTASPVDQCVDVGVGRINCCSQQGCADADGVICSVPLDGVTCDPTGVTPVDQPPQNGLCFSGTCVAQTGPCVDVPCDVDPEDPCRRNDCNQVTGQCEPFIVTQFVECRSSEGVDALCHGGTCIAENSTIPGPCGSTNCDDNNQCTYNECISLTLTESGPWECRNDPKPDGSICYDNGNESQCLVGVCEPIITSQCDHEVNAPDREFPEECGDGRECTYDRCDFFDQCVNPRKPNGTSCDNGNGQCFLGNCQPVIGGF
jgi:hypothetical protein